MAPHPPTPAPAPPCRSEAPGAAEPQLGLSRPCRVTPEAVQGAVRLGPQTPPRDPNRKSGRGAGRASGTSSWRHAWEAGPAHSTTRITRRPSTRTSSGHQNKGLPDEGRGGFSTKPCSQHVKAGAPGTTPPGPSPAGCSAAARVGPMGWPPSSRLLGTSSLDPALDPISDMFLEPRARFSKQRPHVDPIFQEALGCREPRDAV